MHEISIHSSDILFLLYWMLKDIAGLPVGHAPLTLTSVFRKLIDMHANVFCEEAEQPQ